MSFESRREVGVCLLDEAGVVLDFDPEFARLIGTGLIEVGEPLARAVDRSVELPGPDQPAAEFRLARGGEQIGLRCRRSAAGTVAFTVTAQAIKVESVLAQQLRVARQTLDSVINASPLAMLTVDRDQRVVMWNPAAERMFGWTSAEILGQPYPIVPEEERPRFQLLFEQVVLDGEGFTGIVATRRRKDGSRIEVNMHTAPLRDGVGRVTGGVALLEDLTDQRQLEERSRQGQKMEAIGRLAGGIAHDFNNLLTVVLGNADLLILDENLSTDARERVDEIFRVGRSARELVAQLMTFSRRQITRPEDLDLNERVVNARGLFERLLGRDVELRLEPGPEQAQVRIDPSQLDQILVNLVVNARDAMPDGGQLRIRTAIVERERGGLLAQGSYVCLEVGDDGVGIAADVLPHIFEPFFTTKSSGGGTGLGLANVYSIVRHAGGDVVAESEAGVGSRFAVYLPLAIAPVRRPVTEAPEFAFPRGNERILLVEDNVAVRNSTAKLLMALGYQVETACDGGDALARWDRLVAVDLVITDLAMPVLGGAELAEQLRVRAPELPIVFMSGNLDLEDLRLAIEQGDARFLQKPVSLRELAQVTREVLDAAHAARSELS